MSGRRAPPGRGDGGAPGPPPRRTGAGAAPDPAPLRRTIMQGEFAVSDEPDVVVSTILGSCVAACLYDPLARVGGMNHFLLPEAGPGAASGEARARYGAYAMELLINAMLARGAGRARLRARLYGGAAMHEGMRPIGAENARFAVDFLKAEGIPLAGSDLGGTAARRLDFEPATGRVRCRLAAAPPPPPPPPAAPARAATPVGEIEFF